MIRHFDFIEGTPTEVAADRCILVVESKERRIEADGTSRLSYSACYKDNPKLSYEFSSTSQFKRWLYEQGLLQPLADALP